MRTFGRAVALLLILSPFVAFAADDKEHPELDAKTYEVMKKLGALHKDAKSLRTEAVIELTIMPEEGEKKEIKLKSTIDMQRPDKFSLRTKGAKDDKAGFEYITDGKNLVTYRNKDKNYIEAKAPKNLERVGQSLLPLGPQGSGMLFQNVLAKDPLEALLDGVTKGEHAGMEKVNGKECHHLKFVQENLDWELWVAAEGQPWVLKATSAQSFNGTKMTTVETYSNWKLDAEPAKDAFTFTPPEGSKKVKSLGRGEDDE